MREREARLAMFDYAFAHLDLDDRLAPFQDGGLSNYLYSYIEAGIPVIVSSLAPGIADLVRSTGIGVVASCSDLCNLRSILASTDYVRLIDNLVSHDHQFAFDVKTLNNIVFG